MTSPLSLEFSDYIVICTEIPNVAYGPFEGPDAVSFAEYWNAWYAEHEVDCKFIVVPLTQPR